MKKKSLFRRVSGVLTGVFFSTSLILAANENGQLFGSETLIVVVALLLLFVPLFLYVRKLHSNMNDRSDRIIKENAALESLNKEISSRNEEVNTRNEELDSRNKSLEGQIEQQEERYRVLREQNDDLAKANSDLVRKNNELELVISTLNNNKKELEQLIVTKIKENDMIQREAADKLAEAEKRLKDALPICRFNPRPAVAYLEAIHVALADHTQFYATPLGVFHGIAEQVNQDLPQMPFIAKHPVRQILLAVQHQIQPLGFGAGFAGNHGDAGNILHQHLLDQLARDARAVDDQDARRVAGDVPGDAAAHGRAPESGRVRRRWWPAASQAPPQPRITALASVSSMARHPSPCSSK